ncbi:Isochorismatase hydrolase [Basidiobolus meristosporus CBS 931.73]|uniref:Isochorismatase hydrolase n=1 Tax=Basidiobolus meristosporus CBS 931.73 TaxID=1314790 RepID=A0A1Y1Y676_9FUNG|nr:Isochorismatase hydrolase [Basidiobolus meristosporus CBS 931.73]|eukprot:ORX93084.1 Isochorismatase hydrolase [Basidiobolus meristosporus CBS 931.73]
MNPLALREIAGASTKPSPLEISKTALILIDVQNEYLSNGQVPIHQLESHSFPRIQRLVQKARSIHLPVIHVVHHLPGESAPIFNSQKWGSQIIEQVAPQNDEAVIVKHHVSAWKDTQLEETLQKKGIQNLILVGYGTHMCVNSAARDGAEKGYQVVVVGNACGARALKDGLGHEISAEEVHQASLASLWDYFAVIVAEPEDLVFV